MSTGHSEDLHATQYVLELADGELSQVEPIDLDALRATRSDGLASAGVPTDALAAHEAALLAAAPGEPEPNKFCVMHPDPACATRLKLCEECTRYMYSDAALVQRRQLTACLSGGGGGSSSDDAAAAAHNPHRLDLFHLPRGCAHLGMQSS